MLEELPVYRITDHALLRWLERVHGVDVDWFRAQLHHEVQQSVMNYGEIVEGDGSAQFLLDGDAVVTVLRPGDRLKKAKWIGGYPVPRRVDVFEAAQPLTVSSF